MGVEKWYTPNSSIVSYIKPERRKAGGGVTESMLVDTYEEAVEQAKRYTKQHIASAKAHLRTLEKL